MSAVDRAARATVSGTGIALRIGAALVLLAPAAIWYRSTGTLAFYLSGLAPPGQLAYVLAKLCGLYAGLLLVLQAFYALLCAPRQGGGRPVFQRRWHMVLGGTIAVLALAHAGLFMTAVALRRGGVDWSLLWPDFATGFYRSALSLGLLALWAMLAGVSAGLLRRRFARGWHRVHRAGVAAVFLTLAHALLVGTEANILILSSVYWGLGVGALALLIRRRLRTVATADD